MVETTLAVGDLITAIPTLYYQLEKPIAVILLITGGISGAFSLHRGFGHAAGKVIGGIALAALVFGGLSLAHSINATVNLHSGGGPVMVDTGYIP
jgi:hypothetical protein